MVQELVRKSVIALAVIVAGGIVATLGGSAAALAWGAEFAGPGPAVTGNDTGGIFPYSPDVEPIYHQIARHDWPRLGRFATFTSLPRRDGAYAALAWHHRRRKIH